MYIIQKNESHKLQQIRIMCAIYQGGYATIIALSGDSANAGLPRVGQTKTPYRQLNCSIDGTRLVGLGPSFENLTDLPWGKRAWTLQEAVLSTRCVFISQYPTFFACNVIIRCETYHGITALLEPAVYIFEVGMTWISAAEGWGCGGGVCITGRAP